jgi:murein DD-endopeptidase MepM/ murein hydrolase activator NlpD
MSASKIRLLRTIVLEGVDCMHKRNALQWIHRIRQFFAGHGFALLTVLCVACITSAALWTGKPASPVPPATPPAPGHFAASLMQQQLEDAVTPTPLPTDQPIIWHSPIPEFEILQRFSGNAMVRSSTTGMRGVHHGVDLGAKPGAAVAAIAPGRVLETGEGGMEGIWISIRHSGGYVSRYASLSMLGAFREGDPVSAGQTIGFVGNTHLEETALGPHLHLQLHHDGAAIDPLELLP